MLGTDSVKLETYLGGRVFPPHLQVRKLMFREQQGPSQGHMESVEKLRLEPRPSHPVWSSTPEPPLEFNEEVIIPLILLNLQNNDLVMYI